MDNTIIAKITSELAEVKTHKGYNVVLNLYTKSNEKISVTLDDNGTFYREPTIDDNGIVTIPSDKTNFERTQTDSLQTTTYLLKRTTIPAQDIERFEFEYKRDVKATITTSQE